MSAFDCNAMHIVLTFYEKLVFDFIDIIVSYNIAITTHSLKQFMNGISTKSRFKEAQLSFIVAKVWVTKYPIKMSAQWNSMELNFEVLRKRNRKKLFANKWKRLLMLLQINQNKNFVLIKLINYLKINLSKTSAQRSANQVRQLRHISNT